MDRIKQDPVLALTVIVLVLMFGIAAIKIVCDTAVKVLH